MAWYLVKHRDIFTFGFCITERNDRRNSHPRYVMVLAEAWTTHFPMCSVILKHERSEKFRCIAHDNYSKTRGRRTYVTMEGEEWKLLWPMYGIL